MTRRQSIRKRALASVAVAVLFAGSGGAEAERTKIVGTDDWPADSFVDVGAITCARGDVEWLNEVTPVCSDGGRLKLRGTLAYSCVEVATLDGLPEARFSGVALFSLNANFNSAFAGPVWGTWILVPSEVCDAELLMDPEVFWAGTWRGKRAQVCASDQCSWVGELKFVGLGHGGALDRLRFRGSETILTFTPLPVPYELLGMCAPEQSCAAEGHLVGTIRH